MSYIFTSFDFLIIIKNNVLYIPSFFFGFLPDYGPERTTPIRNISNI